MTREVTLPDGGVIRFYEGFVEIATSEQTRTQRSYLSYDDFEELGEVDP